jgi:hypothetical protein
MKRLLVGLLLATAMFAETVTISANGKTYHTSNCAAAQRIAKPIKVERADAEKHGLKPCGICNRAKSGKSQRNAWAVRP